ncbi:RNA-binding domain-containing protein [Tuber magnatum]|uniref:RNA-binding domain-containing protein n=1 Tax=Tuber magnatum TaxID=42249 RepID=A0A317SEF9_9PEZI|nr:RNA-binding domain-containing protein [Tuber magnatum]
MSETTRLKSTIFIGGLDQSVTEEILQSAFLPFGDINSVQLPRDDRHPTTAHRGFGYVEFEVAADALAAIDNMDQAVLAGRVLNVMRAKPQKEGTVLGSKVAVWAQESWLAKHEVSEEDRAAAEKAKAEAMAKEGVDPMQGLEGLDVAGPRPE